MKIKIGTNKIMKRKILITGSNGFIGSFLFEKFIEDNYDVYGCDKSYDDIQNNERLYKVNILDLKGLKILINSIKPNIIIHLAARTDLGFDDTIDNFEDNTKGVENIVKICNEFDFVNRLLFTSTILVCKKGLNPKSDTFFNPQSLYGESKVIGEKIIRKSLNKKWTIIRPTSIWGPSKGSNYESFFKSILKNQYFHIKNHSPKITFGFIGNFCYQIDLIIKNDNLDKSVLYLGDYEPTCLKNWADLIAKEFSSKKLKSVNYFAVKILAIFGDLLLKIKFKGFPINSYRLQNLTNDRIYDLQKTKKNLGDSLPYDLKTSTKLTTEWIKKIT
jgi:nucleoside-diphosphate-sugar epimerase